MKPERNNRYKKFNIVWISRLEIFRTYLTVNIIKNHQVQPDYFLGEDKYIHFYPSFQPFWHNPKKKKHTGLNS